MRALILSAASVFCLLGCTTPQEQALKQQAEMNRMMAEFGPACVQLGYPANSDPWRNCVVQLAAKNDSKRSGVSTSIFGSWGRSGWGSGSGVGIGIGVGR
ncbi:hypothetical protein [Massilia niastensis]|uniref:hypothetical protein n=1 Tax=Massilia niastensis TaxID=544911 RepID=UPI0012EB3491|nr:hypothetical protein [Massilia niastensis]